MQPTVGRIVLYKLTAEDAEHINSSRTTHRDVVLRREKNTRDVVHWPFGAQAHIGNLHSEGMLLPAIVVNASPSTEPGVINLQVFLDGNDVMWITRVTEGNQDGQYRWPDRVITGEAETQDEPKKDELSAASDKLSSTIRKRSQR